MTGRRATGAYRQRQVLHTENLAKQEQREAELRNAREVFYAWLGEQGPAFASLLRDQPREVSVLIDAVATRPQVGGR